VSKPLLTEPEASGELEDSAWWFEGQRSGLGQRFFDAVDASVERISRFPQSGALYPQVPPDLEIRRVPVKRFPYHVVYLETAEAIRILAVAHDRRRPGYWLSRIER